MQAQEAKNKPKTKAERRAEMSAAERQEEAEELRLQGNEAFKQGSFANAHELYSTALQLASNNQKAVR